MQKEKAKELFYGIIQSIKDDNREKAKEIIKGMDIESIENDYIGELLESLKNEICSRKAYYNEEYCLEVIKEIACTMEIEEIVDMLEGNIEPESNILYCPNCQGVVYITDEYSQCECGWSTNY